MEDRRLIGRLLQREVEIRGSWSKFAGASGVSRATLYRVRDADETVTIRIWRQIEAGLGLPYDSFASVAAHDFDVLRELGVEEGLVRWLEREASKSGGVARAT